MTQLGEAPFFSSVTMAARSSSMNWGGLGQSIDATPVPDPALNRLGEAFEKRSKGCAPELIQILGSDWEPEHKALLVAFPRRCEQAPSLAGRASGALGGDTRSLGPRARSAGRDADRRT